MGALLLALAKSICYALSAHANNIFQKQTAFVFTESQSRDQLMQKAYSKHKAIYRSCRGRYKQQLFCCFCLFKSLCTNPQGRSRGNAPKELLMLEISCFSNVAIFS